MSSINCSKQIWLQIIESIDRKTRSLAFWCFPNSLKSNEIDQWKINYISSQRMMHLQQKFDWKHAIILIYTLKGSMRKMTACSKCVCVCVWIYALLLFVWFRLLILNAAWNECVHQALYYDKRNQQLMFSTVYSIKALIRINIASYHFNAMCAVCSVHAIFCDIRNLVCKINFIIS